MNLLIKTSAWTGINHQLPSNETGCFPSNDCTAVLEGANESDVQFHFNPTNSHSTLDEAGQYVACCVALNKSTTES